MTLAPALQLVVIALASARVTGLITSDVILEYPRGILLAKFPTDSYRSYLLTCARCCGWWVSLAWAGAWLRWPDGTTRWAVPWAVASAAFWLGWSWFDTITGAD